MNNRTCLFHLKRNNIKKQCYSKILAMVDRIRSIVLHNDSRVEFIQEDLNEVQGKMTVKKQGTLRWKMEANLGKKDRYVYAL